MQKKLLIQNTDRKNTFISKTVTKHYTALKYVFWSLS